MDESMKSESHLTSAAAFVEGGIQEACDDACSICLEDFCDSDPSTLTTCKHEFHLQCILEWCQRSSQCPMCWQSISLKDPTSQELLEGVVSERALRNNPPRNATIFHHPTLGDFELQHLPIGANDSELEERIIQHLAAAAAMGRAHHISRREGQRNRSNAQGRPQFLVLSHPNAPTSPTSASLAQRGGQTELPPAVAAATTPSVPLTSVVEESSLPMIPQLVSPQTDFVPASATGFSTPVASERVNIRNSASHSAPINQDRAGPSEFQSLSESLKSRFSAASMRYKESITKSTKGWKEKLFSRNTSMADLGSEVKREVNAGIASVSRLMERLETRENSRTDASVASNSVSETGNQMIAGTQGSNSMSDSKSPASCSTTSSQS